MNSRLPLLWGFFLLSAAAHAQQGAFQDGPAAQANLNNLAAGAPTVVPTGASEGTKGSAYADGRWLQAQLTLSNGLPLAPVPLKYDVLGHRLLMRAPARPKDTLQLDDRQVVRFVLQEPASALGPARQRVFRRFLEAPHPQQRADYVEVLHEGRYTLVKHHVKTLTKANAQGAYNNGNRYDEIVDRSVYYLRTPDAELIPVKLVLKALQSAAPALAPALKTAVAAQKPKTEGDWAAVFATLDPSPAK